MRILHIISGDLWAGAEVQVFQTLLDLNIRNEISVFCVVFNNGKLLDRLRYFHIECDIINEKSNNSGKMLWKLRKIIRNYAPDAIHAHKTKEHFLSVFAAVLAFRKIPIIRTVHGANAVSKSLSLLQQLRSNVVVGLDWLLIKWGAKGIIAVSKDLKEIIYSKRPQGKIELIYNSINLRYIQSFANDGNIREKFDIGNLFWIGVCARLVEVKNLAMLIQSAGYLAKKGFPFRVSIFGDGPQQKALESLISQLDLNDCVTMHGFEDNILAAINSLDVFVLCSHHEGLPMSLLEAMALGRAIVCTAVGGMKEIIQQGINGLLVPDNDSAALAHALYSLYTDKDLSKKLSLEAQATIAQRFNIIKANDALIKVYSECKKRITSPSLE